MTTATQAIGMLDVPADKYFAIRALSNSGMKDLSVSPYRYWFKHINSNRSTDEEETKALRMGTALHCAVLEPMEFDKRFVRAFDPSVWPTYLDTVADLREWITEAGVKPKGTTKEALAAQAADLMESTGSHLPIIHYEKQRYASRTQGRTVLSADEWSRVTGMSNAVRGEKAIQFILANGRAEVPMVAKDPETGVLLKCKVDWLDEQITFDLKSFTQKRGASINESVCDAIFYEKYYRQAYLYQLIRRLVMQDKSIFVLGFVESDEPHEVRIKQLRSQGQYEGNLYWQRAKTEVHAMIRQYADCLDRFGENPWREAQNVEPLIDEDMKQLAY